MLNCSNVYMSTGEVESEEPPSCYCEHLYVWSTTYLKCVPNCSQYDNTNNGQLNTAKNGTECVCRTTYVWNVSQQQCIIDCSKYANTNLTAVPDTTDSCVCRGQLIWDHTKLVCYIDCTADAYANGSLSNTSCRCIANYTWSTRSFRCELNCSRYPNVNRTGIP